MWKVWWGRNMESFRSENFKVSILQKLPWFLVWNSLTLIWKVQKCESQGQLKIMHVPLPDAWCHLPFFTTQLGYPDTHSFPKGTFQCMILPMSNKQVSERAIFSFFVLFLIQWHVKKILAVQTMTVTFGQPVVREQYTRTGAASVPPSGESACLPLRAGMLLKVGPRLREIGWKKLCFIYPLQAGKCNFFTSFSHNLGPTF